MACGKQSKTSGAGAGPGPLAVPGGRGEFGIQIRECPQEGSASPRQARGAAAQGTGGTGACLPPALPEHWHFPPRLESVAGMKLISLPLAHKGGATSLENSLPVCNCAGHTLLVTPGPESPSRDCPPGLSPECTVHSCSLGQLSGSPRARAGGAGAEEGLRPLPMWGPCGSRREGRCPRPAAREGRAGPVA